MNKNNLTTIDLKESSKFSKYYSDWWDLNGPFKPLHKLNKIRINFIIEQLSIKKNEDFKPLKRKKILDIGCGGGILCESLARLGASVTGIDTSNNAIKIAKEHSKKNNLKIKYFKSEISNFRANEKYDIITSMEVLEHVNNIEQFLKYTHSLINNKGMFFGSTINKTIRSYFLSIYIAEKILKIIPKGTHNWEKYINPNSLKIKLIKQNFSGITIKGMKYNPFSNIGSYSNSNSVNYLFSAYK
ncbi:bifunctional 2-polyprenyl-6-hydroxyphenol methylase/3-demethylubiquinol 3-O-methyltransferase UbiG [Rickettsiales bacterium]|nr:bifunctional 2-polyprenyl-6-hydroxyphenol methylase/3-demethylubiquinol 3-O-methyltransferase UbiG [Rickettsiales bacterium]